jgi:hypothetical protein
MKILPLEKQALMLRRTGFSQVTVWISALKSFDVYTDGFGEFKSKEDY